MSDIFQEVDEAVLTDKARQRWKTFGPIVYAIVAIIILGVAGYEFFKWQSGQSQAQASEAYYSAEQALEKPDYVLADALFTEIFNSDSPFSAAAAHHLAEIKISQQGDRAAAIEILSRAAEGEGPLAETARLKAAYLMADTAELADLEIFLAPLTADLTSPYGPLAQEILASRAYSLGNYDEAEKLYRSISLGLDAPEGAKARAERALAALDAIKAKNGSAS